MSGGTQNDREKKLAYFAEELNGVDDRFLAEAMAKRARGGLRRPVKILLLAALLSVLLTVALLPGALLFRNKGGASATPPNDNLPDNLSLEEAVLALDREDFPTLSEEALPPLLFSGKVVLLWEEDGDEIAFLEVGDETLGKRIRASLLSEKERTPVSSPEDSGFRFWVSLGDGRVLSPYLRVGGGVSYGALSDYLPETVPSENMKELLLSALSAA